MKVVANSFCSPGIIGPHARRARTNHVSCTKLLDNLFFTLVDVSSTLQPTVLCLKFDISIPVHFFCVRYLLWKHSISDLPSSVSSLIQQRRLKLFGHIARAAASEDHSRALPASTDPLSVDWCRPRGRPRQSWLRTIESDLKPLNLGLHSALRRATDRHSWRRIVETAMLFEHATRWWWARFI